MKHVRIGRSFASLAALAVAGFAAALGGAVRAPLAEGEGPAPEAERMARAARAFLASLDEPRRAKAALAFDEARLDWHFVPKIRAGLPMGEMTRGQNHLAEALLGCALSADGSVKVRTIMSLEEVLREIESPRDPRAAERRNPDNYYIAIYGEPDASPDAEPWGWRVEGHHVSLNFTVAGGRVVASEPAFLGANPHEVREGPRAGTRPLGEEEDRGRRVLAALGDAGRTAAIVAAAAPDDIFTGAARRALVEGPAVGVSWTAMEPEARAALRALMDLYADNLIEEVAAERREKIEAAIGAAESGSGELRFAWMGETEPGGPHYYRVHASSFLIEYDNVQNGANHSHTVWRDFDGDFGLDWLAIHRAEAHAE